MIRVGERLREIGDARFEPLVGFARKLSDEHLELARDELQVGEDVGERVVDFVADARGEDADRGHAIHLDHGGGDLVSLREIPSDDHRGQRSFEHHFFSHHLDVDRSAVPAEPALIDGGGTTALGGGHRARRTRGVGADDPGERLADDGLRDRNAETLEGLGVRVHDAAITMDHDEVGRRLDDEPKARLRLLPRGIGTAPFGANATVPDLSRDRWAEACEVILEEVVVGAGAHDLHRGVFADCARDHDEREVHRAPAHDRERAGRIQVRHRVVAEDDVPALVERTLEIGCSLHTLARDLELRAFQLAEHERCVVVGVLDEKEPKWFRLRAHRA